MSIWPWSREKHAPEASDEAQQALATSRKELAAAQRLAQQVGEVREAASQAMVRNHFGAAVTTVFMGGPRNG